MPRLFSEHQLSTDERIQPTQEEPGYGSPILGRQQRGYLGLLILLVGLLLSGCTPQLGAVVAGWNALGVADGVVYVGTRQGEVVALVDNGFEGVNTRWTFPPDGSPEAPGGTYSPAAVSNDLVYLSAANGQLYALDRETGDLGETGWKGPPGQPEDLEPLVSGPALGSAGTNVVVGSGDGNLYAYNALDGNPLPWSPFRAGDKIWSTPVIEGGVVYFGSHDHYVYAVSLQDGSVLWRFATEGAVVSRPLVFNDMIIIGSFDTNLYAIDAASGRLNWQFSGDNWFWAGALTDGQTIFAPNMDGNLYALNPQGELLWGHDMGSPIVAQPALVPRGVVVAGKDGKLSLLDPNPSDIGSGRDISSLFIRDAEVKAPLVAVDDSVYVGAQNNTVRRIQARGTMVQMWCYHTENVRCE